MTLNVLIWLIYCLIAILIFLWLVLIYNYIKKTYKVKSKTDFKKSIVTLLDSSNQKNTLVKLLDKKKLSKWELASLLIKVNNVTEDNSIINIAEESGLVEHYNKDLKNKNWNKRATAILFNYGLNLDNNIDFIKTLTNNDNTLVRREAQIAVIKSLGWKTLKIFPKMNQPISLWQQIRIIEQLKKHHPIVNTKFIEVAKQAKNPHVIQLLLRLIKTFEVEHQLDFILTQTNTPFHFINETAQEALKSYSVLQC
jgi:hypothetical protein